MIYQDAGKQPAACKNIQLIFNTLEMLGLQFTRNITLPVGQCLLIVLRNAKVVREKFLHLEHLSHFLSRCLAFLDGQENWGGSTNHPFELTSSEVAETRGNRDINMMVKCDWTILL